MDLISKFHIADVVTYRSLAFRKPCWIGHCFYILVENWLNMNFSTGCLQNWLLHVYAVSVKSLKAMQARGRKAHSWVSRLETVRVSHWPITWPIYLPCTVAQQQAHCASNIVSNSHLFHSKSIILPIPKIWLLKVWPWKSKVKVKV